MTRSIYTLIFSLLLPFVLLRMLLRSRKAPEYRRRWLERFGVFPALERPCEIWFHTVSVGEFLAAIPLIEQVMAANPNKNIMITTTTPTGSAQVKQKFKALLGHRVQHVYLPYDIPVFLSAFLHRVQPRLLVILETELWPNLIVSTSKSGCQVMVVNARLSEKSAKGYAKFERIAKPMFAAIDQLAVQNHVDAERFVGVGMPAENMSVTGSIKFDVTVNETVTKQADEHKAKWGRDRPVWIMASTHGGEDEIALSAHQQILKVLPNALLIIVPRHPERFKQVANLIETEGFVLARRSDNASIEPSSQVLLVDAMGELMDFLAASRVACMGGSFIESGGYNPLEPAALGLPVILGPSQFNFAQICQLLSDAGAMKTVINGAELAQQVLAWLESDEECRVVGQAAKSVVAQNRGAKQKVFELIQGQLDLA